MERRHRVGGRRKLRRAAAQHRRDRSHRALANLVDEAPDRSVPRREVRREARTLALPRFTVLLERLSEGFPRQRCIARR